MKASDLDILVLFSKPVGWEFFELEKFLENTLGIKVDLATPASLKERFKQRILKQLIYI